MEASPNSFAYNSFKEKDQIRLLTLHPCSDVSAPASCTIFHVSLDEHPFLFERTTPNPVYETLSYTWGSPSDTKPIQLSKEDDLAEQFLVTKNLEVALRCIRHATTPRTLWIDAICINQADREERAEQVTVMSRIYRRASRNLLWLGDEDEDSIAAFRSLDKYDTARAADSQEVESYDYEGLPVRRRKRDWFLERANKRPNNQKAGPFTIKSAEQRARNEKAWKEIESLPSKAWDSIRATFNHRPVWSRIWILQEVVSAKDIVIMCGTMTMRWQVLADFVEACMQFSTDYVRQRIDEHIIDCIDRVYYIQVFREAQSGSLTTVSDARTSVLPVWRFFSSWESTDPRDRIYALSTLGINMANVFPVPRPVVRPDYNVSPKVLFCATVRADIEATKTLDALCLGHALDDTTATPVPPPPSSSTNTDSHAPSVQQLPSWVPNFASSAPRANPHIHRYRDDRYTASGKTKPSLAKLPSIATQAEQDTLSLRGIALQQITKLNPNTTRDRRKFEDLQALMRRMKVVQDQHVISATAGANTVSFSYERHGFTRGLDGIENWLIARPDGSQGDALVGSAPEYDDTVGNDFPAIMVCLSGYIFATTKGGLKCMVPETSKPGDLVVILYGSGVPHVLRKATAVDQDSSSLPSEGGSQDQYQLIGTAYVHDYMHGEALTELESKLLEEQDFHLI